MGKERSFWQAAGGWRRRRQPTAASRPTVRGGADQRKALWIGMRLLLGTWLLVLASLPAQAQRVGWPRRDPTRAADDRATREEALKLIPLEAMDATSRAQVDAVLSGLTIFRRLPVRVVPCDPELFLFLVRHPDVVVATWQVLGISEMELHKIGAASYRLTDKWGTDAVARFVYQDEDTHVVYVEGTCGGPLFARPARGSALLLLKSGWVREPDGRYYITARLDAFVRVDNGGLELLTKAFQPVIGRVVDNNFTQTIAFVGCLSRTAEINPNGLRRLAAKLTPVDAPVRRRFAQLAVRVAERAEATARSASRRSSAASAETRR